MAVDAVVLSSVRMGWSTAGGVLFDTAAGIGGFAKRGVKGAWNKLKQFGGWARGKVAGMGGGEGPVS
ncbi:hypothetical protein N5V81_12850 [Escherichia coli]|nr:hypothetical protein [Escherichia coli]